MRNFTTNDVFQGALFSEYVYLWGLNCKTKNFMNMYKIAGFNKRKVSGIFSYKKKKSYLIRWKLGMIASVLAEQ